MCVCITCRHQTKLRELCDSTAAETTRLESELNDITSGADHVDSVRRLVRSTAESFRRQVDAEERALLARLDASDIGGKDVRAAAAALRDRVGRLSAVRRLAESIADRQGVELLLLHGEVEARLAKERELATAGQSSQSGGAERSATTTAFRGGRVHFVPGVANLGELETVEVGAVVAAAGDNRCPTCRRRPAAGVRDQATATVESAAPVLVDKAVNTRARGLLHSGAGGSGKSRHQLNRSISMTTESGSEPTSP